MALEKGAQASERQRAGGGQRGACSRSYTLAARFCRHMSSTERYSSSNECATGCLAWTALTAPESRDHASASKLGGSFGARLSGLMVIFRDPEAEVEPQADMAFDPRND